MSLQSQLEQGIQTLGLSLTEQQVAQMLSYLQLMQKWNSVYNLTAIRQAEDMVRQHLLDSLSVVFAFADAKRVLDVGSGGGLPGIVLAICYPEIEFTLVDTVSKKTAFLSQVKAELGLKNLRVHTGRVEAMQVEHKFDRITSRAFSELANFINWSCHLLAEQGKYLAMKGQKPDHEIEVLPAGWEITQIQSLAVPGLEAERHLIWIQAAANNNKD